MVQKLQSLKYNDSTNCEYRKMINNYIILDGLEGDT